VTASGVLVAPTYAVVLLDVFEIGPDTLDDTDTLVAESHVGCFVVLMGATETGSGDFNEDLVI
jgi:hypothetical protein